MPGAKAIVANLIDLVCYETKPNRVAVSHGVLSAPEHTKTNSERGAGAGRGSSVINRDSGNP